MATDRVANRFRAGKDRAGGVMGSAMRVKGRERKDLGTIRTLDKTLLMGSPDVLLKVPHVDKTLLAPFEATEMTLDPSVHHVHVPF